MYRAYKNRRSYDPRRPIYPWLYQIARNLCISKRTRKKETDRLEVEPVSKGHDPLTSLSRASTVRDVHAAIDKLSEKHREIIHLKHFQECSYEEMALILDIPIGTVMSRLYGARKSLREIMEELEL